MEDLEEALRNRAAKTPTLTPRSIRTSGRMHRFRCERFDKRPILLLSDSELAEFLRLYRQDSTLDVESQKECDLDATIRIAFENEIRYPKDKKGNLLTITTDLVALHEKNGRLWSEAVSVKPVISRLSPRAERVLRIEERYHRDRGATWSLARSQGLNSDWARNLWWLFPYSETAIAQGYTDEQLSAHSELLKAMRRESGRSSISDLCNKLITSGKLRPGEAMRAFRELLAIKCVDADLNVPDLTRLRVSAFSIRGYDLINEQRRRLGKKDV